MSAPTSIGDGCLVSCNVSAPLHVATCLRLVIALPSLPHVGRTSTDPTKQCERIAVNLAATN